MGRILGIDYGAARTGIAISDPLGITAQGLETINSGGSDKVILRRIAELVENYDVEKFVIGNPLNMNGTESERSKLTQEFIHKLNSRFNTIPVVQVDERLTTVQAEHLLISNDTSRKKRKKVIDSVAATIILQSYHDRKGR